MNEKDVERICRESGALLTGHFQLRSGMHSDHFFQAALLLQYPDKAETVCRFLAEKFAGVAVESVISPAVGGLIVGQEVARALGCRAIFADKEDGQLILKRGFSIRPGEKVLVAEDVVTKGGEVVGGAVGVDRSGGAATFDVPFFSALKLTLPAWDPAACALCAAGVPVDRPGSK